MTQQINIKALLKESQVSEETANLIEKTIIDVIETKIGDSATEQARVAQKAQEEIDEIKNTYNTELKSAVDYIKKMEDFYNEQVGKAVQRVLEVEKFYNEQSQVAVDKILTGMSINESLEEKISLLESTSLQEENNVLKSEIAGYIKERANLIEAANLHGEHIRNVTLTEMDNLIKEATQEFIKEHQEQFNQLDKLSQYESTILNIKESFEKIGLGLSEDLAYQGLQESIVERDAKIALLESEIKNKAAILFESQKKDVFNKLTESSSEIEKAKFMRLSEAITASDIDTYEKTLTCLIESISDDNLGTTKNQNLNEKIALQNEILQQEKTNTNDKNLKEHSNELDDIMLKSGII